MLPNGRFAGQEEGTKVPSINWLAARLVRDPRAPGSALLLLARGRQKDRLHRRDRLEDPGNDLVLAGE